MDGGKFCRKCEKPSVVFDEWEGADICELCGLMDDSQVLWSEVGYDANSQRMGVAIGGDDDGSQAARKQLFMLGRNIPSSMRQGIGSTSKKGEMVTTLRQVAACLRLNTAQTQQAENVLEQAVEGFYGGGRWVKVLCAACIYVVIRREKLPLSMLDVALAIQCDVFEVGAMFTKLKAAIACSLPPVESNLFISRALSLIPQFQPGGSHGAPHDLRQVTRQVSTLVECARQHSLFTGRLPVPMTMACILLVAKLHKIPLNARKVCDLTNSCFRTMYRRHKEMKDILVAEGKKFPWGSQITTSTLPQHMQFLMQYLEASQKAAKADASLATPKLLPTGPPANGSVPGVKENEEMNKRKRSPDSESAVSRDAAVSREPDGAEASKQQRIGDEGSFQEGSVPQAETRWEEESHEGREPITERQVADKESGILCPPSFGRSLKMRQRRANKILLARQRIKKAFPDSPFSAVVTTNENQPSHKGDQGAIGPLDDEDLLIERLLIRGVPDEQIMLGYFKTAMDSSERNDSNPEASVEDNLAEYIRTPKEVELLISTGRFG